MRKKIKITFPITPVAPDPPPFVCDVCGKESQYWQSMHQGKKNLCMSHQRRGNRQPMRLEMDWLDNLQLSAIATVIWEIQHVRN